MKLKNLKERSALTEKQVKNYQELQNLINALNEKELTDEFVIKSNEEIDVLNQKNDADKDFLKQTLKTQAKIYNRAVTKLKYTKKSYYTTLWMSLGLAAFGIPFGTVFGIAVDNMGLLGLGLPFGIAIGLAIGSMLDKKAEQEGRQLVI